MSQFQRLSCAIGLLVVLGGCISACAAPQVHRNAEPKQVTPPLFEQAEGFYVSRDGFYGSPTRVEYLHVRIEEGGLVAHKLVGDANVPRGYISWKTTPGLSSEQFILAAGVQIPAWVQIRIDVTDLEGFSWLSDGCSVTIQPDGTIALVAALAGMELHGTFERVSMEEAVEAANTMADHP